MKKESILHLFYCTLWLERGCIALEAILAPHSFGLMICLENALVREFMVSCRAVILTSHSFFLEAALITTVWKPKVAVYFHFSTLSFHFQISSLTLRFHCCSLMTKN